MRNQRRRHDPSFKARVALEALKGIKTVQQIAKEFEVHPTEVSEWKQALQERLPQAFRSGATRSEGGDFEQERAALHAKIGQLTVEVDFLTKKCKQLGL